MRPGYVSILMIVILLAPSVSFCLETTTITVGGVPLTVEIADDTHERANGLMYRGWLPDDRGMLFVFPDERPLSFWMKNTTIPLSIAFADAKGKIIAILDMTPDDGRTHYRSPAPAKYALEVNRGWFMKRRIEVGDFIVF